MQSLFNLVSFFKDKAEFYLVSCNRDIDGSLPEVKPVCDRWSIGENKEKIYYTHFISPILIYRLFREIKPDIVMVNGVFNISTTLPGLLFGNLFNCKIIFSPRGMLQDWGLKRGAIKKQIYISLLKLFLRKDTIWHATDNQEGIDILKKFGSTQSVFLGTNIPRGISKFTSLPFPDSGQRIKLVFLSLINPNKNLHLIIDAVIKYPNQFTLDIYGPIINEVYWRMCKDKMKALEMFNYLGSIPSWEVPSVLSRYHFFVLPTQGENFGHAIFDSLSANLPVIISKNTPWNHLDKMGAGFYIDIQNEESLVALLDKISKMKKEEYSKFREAACEYAKRFWDSKDYQKEYQFLFDV